MFKSRISPFPPFLAFGRPLCVVHYHNHNRAEITTITNQSAMQSAGREEEEPGFIEAPHMAIARRSSLSLSETPGMYFGAVGVGECACALPASCCCAVHAPPPVLIAIPNGIRRAARLNRAAGDGGGPNRQAGLPLDPHLTPGPRDTTMHKHKNETKT